MEELTRYSVITDKNPREIVLLRGMGCAWSRCTFCDYHLDRSSDAAANFALNRSVLAQVTGVYHHLEVINSGSFCELDADTLDEVERICREKEIRLLHFECHWMHRAAVPALRERFARVGVTVKVKIGVETFDAEFREKTLHKGIGVSDPAVIAAPFDECCLLFGLTGQTAESMRYDLETGLAHFERVCVNLMSPNTTNVHPDAAVREVFMQTLAERCLADDRIDLLLENTDFGVGGI